MKFAIFRINIFVTILIQMHMNPVSEMNFIGGHGFGITE